MVGTVTRNPHDRAQEIIEEEVEPSTTVGANGVTSGLLQPREADSNPNLHTPKGVFTGHRKINVDTSSQLHRHKHWRSRTTAVNESESLSDIDDVEVVGYLHNKKEMHYKSILWEALYRDHATGKQRKRTTESRKSTSAQKAAKTTREMENKKRPSSNINYDALKKLTDELEQDSEKGKIKGMDSYSGNDGNSQSDKFSIEMHESGKSNCDEFEHGTNSEDGDTFGEYDGNVYYGYEDEYGNEEDHDYDDDDS